MSGVRVRHRYHRNILYLVPVLKKPFPKPKMCPLCRTAHPCKTVHLHLVDGSAIVSQGVLEELKLAGLPDLDVMEEVGSPPTLKVDSIREEQDASHRRIIQYGSGKAAS